jgi:uracil-DNA glycosylase family 4
MSSDWFFTRSDSRKKAKKAKPQLSVNTMTLLGPEGLKSMNPQARHPDMDPSKPLEGTELYVLGGCPNYADDEEGEHFSILSESGRLLRRHIGRWLLEDTQFDYCVRTRPPSGRVPHAGELGCYRETVEKSIEAAKPKLILLVGNVPAGWMLDHKQVKASRGRLFPVKIRSHSCYAMPILDPAYIAKLGDDRDDKVPGKEWLSVWEADLLKARKFLDEPWKSTPHIPTKAEITEGVEICLEFSHAKKALKFLLKKKQNIGFDIETTGLRPYSKGAEILSIALSTGPRTFSIPLDHPGSKWTAVQLQQIVGMLRDLFLGPSRFVAHNLSFDLEWMVDYLGEGILLSRYGCSMQAHYVLDPGPPSRGGHLSLDFICMERFGIRLKSMSAAAADVKRLRSINLQLVLEYNALDARWCLEAWKAAREDIKTMRVEEPYSRQVSRIPAIVLAQRKGVPIDTKITQRMDIDFSEKIRKINDSIIKLPDVIEYKKIFGPFNPNSPQDVGKLLTVIGGHADKVRTDKGGYSTAAPILEPLREDEPIADLVLKLRSVVKLQGTYVDRFLPNGPETHLYPDGKIHCQFAVARTRTSRLSSNGPNNQNWPKRKGKFVREQMSAPSGYEFLSFDYGQIEARIIGCTSRDPKWVKMLWEDYDVHMEWAQIAAEIFPGALEVWTGARDWDSADDGQKGTYRGLIKNRLVFPAFFGAGAYSIAGYLGIPEDEAEELFDKFWSTFAGVKKWQKLLWAEYQDSGYVRSLTGRIRLAPLSFNMVCNTPVQGVASDVVVDGMERLAMRSLEEGIPDMAPILNIHDDLTFMTPISERDFFVREISTEMLDFEADWLNVPMVVEGEGGPNLFEMEAFGTFKREPNVQ